MRLDGELRGRMPWATIGLRGKDGDTQEVDVIIDTEFDGELALPAEVVELLEYGGSSVLPVKTGTGEVRPARHVQAILDWDGEDRITQVMVSADGANPLLGVELLEEHSLTITFTRGGEVLVEPL